MQTDPTARHSPIGSFQRVRYLARATTLIGPNLGKLAGMQGHDSSHGRVDPPPAMTVFLGEPLTAGASPDRAESNPSRIPFTDNDQGDTAGPSMQVSGWKAVSSGCSGSPL